MEMKLMDNFFVFFFYNLIIRRLITIPSNVFNYFNAYALQLRLIYVIVYSLLRFVYIINCVNIFHLLLFLINCFVYVL